MANIARMKTRPSSRQPGVSLPAKGDLPVGLGNGATGVMHAGANGTVRVADSTQSTGFSDKTLTEATADELGNESGFISADTANGLDAATWDHALAVDSDSGGQIHCKFLLYQTTDTGSGFRLRLNGAAMANDAAAASPTRQIYASGDNLSLIGAAATGTGYVDLVLGVGNLLADTDWMQIEFTIGTGPLRRITGRHTWQASGARKAFTFDGLIALTGNITSVGASCLSTGKIKAATSTFEIVRGTRFP